MGMTPMVRVGATVTITCTGSAVDAGLTFSRQLLVNNDGPGKVWVDTGVAASTQSMPVPAGGYIVLGRRGTTVSVLGPVGTSVDLTPVDGD